VKATLITVLSLFAVVQALRLGAQVQQSPPRYIVITLPTLGGTYGTAQQMNSSGLISGDANLTGDTTEHATFWRDGLITDLGTLGGLNSGAAEVNAQGLILGFSQTADTDPLGENWGLLPTCSASGGSCQGYQNLVVAVTWENGVATPLPTLGGNNAMPIFTTSLNNQGEAVGFAENSTRDPSCSSPQVLDFEAVIWGPKPDEIRELPPVAGDSIGAAVAINDAGQVVGITGPCGFPSFSLARHAVLWQNGVVTSLPTLGGVMNNAPLSINNRGQIVGISDLRGDTTTHAVIWQNGTITDLGTLPGDLISFAYGINDEGQVIAQSCDVNFNCRGALWQNGMMTDLNALTPPGSLYLVLPQHINNQGEITGQGFDPNTGGTPAFVAIPCDGNHLSDKGCEASAQGADGASAGTTEQPRVVLPENVRKWLQSRRGLGHFGVGAATQQ